MNIMCEIRDFCTKIVRKKGQEAKHNGIEFLKMEIIIKVTFFEIQVQSFKTYDLRKTFRNNINVFCG